MKQPVLACTSFDSHPRGLGDAVLQAKAFVGNEPFVVMLGDDLMDITNDKALCHLPNS